MDIAGSEMNAKASLQMSQCSEWPRLISCQILMCNP